MLAVVLYLYIRMLQKVRCHVPEIELKRVFLDQIRYFAVYIGLVTFVLAYWLLTWANTWGILALPISIHTFGVVGAFVNVLHLVGLIPLALGYRRFTRVLPSCAFNTMMSPVIISAVKEMDTAATDPVNLCEKMDRMLGSGAETLVHEMMSAYGYARYGAVLAKHSSHLSEEPIKRLASIRDESLSYNVEDESIPKVRVTIKNCPVRTTQGSAKRLISSFWAGVFSRHYMKQLNCRDHCYNEGDDDFSFTLSP